ncbi:MAG: threonine-phosphate decarboxylase CobD [Clostridium perfringens]|nr:threonine-phosphate decarboxylase CobD [Clostridium perfringens]
MAKHGGNIEEVARKLKISAEDFLDFSANINPLGLSKRVKNAIEENILKIEKYPDITYHDLKKAIESFEGISYDNILLGNGAAEVIFNVIRGIKPKKALVMAPTFSEYEEALKSVECSVEHFYLKEENKFCITEEILEKIDNSLDILFICNPNNPTGVLTASKNIEKILIKAKKTNTVVAIDESFLDFRGDRSSYECKELLESYKNLVLIKSATKFFAFPGIRIGYGFTTNNDLKKKIEKVSISWSVNTLAKEALIAGFLDKEYIEESLKFVDREKDYLYSELLKIKGLTVFKPSVNFIMIKTQDKALYEKMLEQRIIIRRCNNYYGLSNNFYRVAVRTRKENEKLIEALKLVML